MEHARVGFDDIKDTSGFINEPHTLKAVVPASPASPPAQPNSAKWCHALNHSMILFVSPIRKYEKVKRAGFRS